MDENTAETLKSIQSPFNLKIYKQKALMHSPLESIYPMPRLCKFFQSCHSPAVYQIPHSKLALCKEHFLENVEKRVKKLIEKKHMFHPHREEKLLIAVSGGKDSQVLLSIIRTIYPEGLDMEALYIELGIAPDKYSEDSGIIAKQWCDKLGIPFHSINIESNYGLTMDKLHYLKESYRDFGWHYDLQAYRGECSYCGSFKRHTISQFAHENGFSAVATGHNLTDEATALLNNFFNQKLMFLARPGPKSESETDLLVSRVKPLFYISEEEITMYAYYKNIPFLPTECPYARQSPVNQLKGVLLEIEKYRRGNMIALMRRYYKHMQPVIKKAYKEQHSDDHAENQCNQCGRPTYSKTCSFCRNLKYLKKQINKVDKKVTKQAI
ncbi:MAG: TIGR00269 family protein [Promethearchaeota archaeon]